MLLMEYNYATDIEVQWEETFEKRVSKGIQQGISQAEHQAKIETTKKFLTIGILLNKLRKDLNFSLIKSKI